MYTNSRRPGSPWRPVGCSVAICDERRPVDRGRDAAGAAARRAREIGDERFVRDAHQEWTYGEFAGRVTEVAGGLRELGVRAGRRGRRGPAQQPALPRGLVGDPLARRDLQPGQPGADRRVRRPSILGDSERERVVCTPEAAAGARGAPRGAARAARDRRRRGHATRSRRCAATAASTGTPRSSPATWPPSSTPPAPPAGRRGRCSATPTSSPTPGSSASRCRSAAATRWGWCCRCSTSTPSW